MDQQNTQQTTNPGVPPKNWLVESILVTIFCCLPFGIAGIVFASRVNSAWTAGDFAGAQKASQEAGKWTKIGFFVGIAVNVILWLVWGTAMFAILKGNSSGNF